MSDRLKIYNGKLLVPGRIISNGTVVMDGGMIIEVLEGNIDLPGVSEIGAKGNYVSPGFIDLHIHGGGGYDFMDGTVEAFFEITKLHARYGTTAMLPTTLTSGKQRLLQTLASYEQANLQNTMG